jgi:hypothetical protein
MFENKLSWGAGLTENKTKPSIWSLAIPSIGKLSKTPRGGGGGMPLEDNMAKKEQSRTGGWSRSTVKLPETSLFPPKGCSLPCVGVSIGMEANVVKEKEKVRTWDT